MVRGKCLKVVLALVILGVWLSLSLNQAQAVPSFQRQTGMECNACHTMFPELTPVGRNFKINGFTATKHGDKPYEWPPPVSAMVQLSFTHLNRDMPTGSFDPSNRANDNVNVPQAISLFYGGRIYGEHLGAFVQGTYDGVGNKFFLDNTDIRLVGKPQLFGKDLVLGLTLNNNPTVSDPLNTTPAWGFPSAAPAVALTPNGGAGDRRWLGRAGRRGRGLFFLEQPDLWRGCDLPQRPAGGFPVYGGRHGNGRHDPGCPPLTGGCTCRNNGANIPCPLVISAW